MARMIFVCQHCNGVRAVDYPHARISRGFGRSAVSVQYRFDDAGREILPYQDAVCSCGRRAVGNLVRGVKTSHPCDDRCTSARGSKCECSCGGKNHGRWWIAGESDSQTTFTWGAA